MLFCHAYARHGGGHLCDPLLPDRAGQPHQHVAPGKKTLRFVPVTVLPAIIAIQILSVDSHMEFDLRNPKVIAAVICTLVSLRFGLIWVVISGVVSLILLNQFVFV